MAFEKFTGTLDAAPSGGFVPFSGEMDEPSKPQARGLINSKQDARAQRIAEMDEETDPSNSNYLPITKNAQAALQTDARGGMDAKRTKGQGRVLDADIPRATVGSVAQDIGAGALQIIPTVAKGVGDITRLATGDRAGKGLSEYAEESMDAARNIVGSDRAAAQKKRFEQDKEDKALNPADLIAGNPGALADQILPTLGSMVLPIGASAVAGTLARAGNAAKLAAAIDPATVAARAATASGAAVIATTAAQNAADTYSNIIDKGGSQADAYRGAVIAGSAAALVGKATGGGAEGALARIVGGKSIVQGAREIPKAMAKEAGQEMGEQVGGSLGELSGNGEMFDANKFGKELAVAGTLGAVVGGGANVVSQASSIASDRLAARERTFADKYPVAPGTLPGIPPAPVDPIAEIGKAQTVDQAIAAAQTSVQSSAAVDNISQILQEQGLTRPAGLMTTPAPLADDIAAVTQSITELEAVNAQEVQPVAQPAVLPEQPAAPAIEPALDAAPAPYTAGIELPASASGVLDNAGAPEQSNASLDVAVAGKKKDPASWVIRDKETGDVVMETFDKAKVDALNTVKYEAVPIQDYLVGVNQQIKSAQAKPTDQRLIPVSKRTPETPLNQPQAQQIQAQAAPESVAVYEQPDPVVQRAEAAKKEVQRQAKAGRLRNYTYVKSPFLAFLGKHGVALSRKADFSPDKNPLLSGYGPLFRRAGKNTDLLVQNAIEEHFLPEGADSTALDELISQQISGMGIGQTKRIEAVYSPDVADRVMNERMAGAQDAYEQELAAQQETAQNSGEDPFAPLSALEYNEDDASSSGYNDATQAVQLEVNALLLTAEKLGIDTDELKHQANDETRSGTQQDYLEAARAALKSAIEGSNGNSRPDAGQPSAARSEEVNAALANSPVIPDRLPRSGASQEPARTANTGSDSAGPAFDSTLKPDGTLAVKGDAAAIREALKDIPAKSLVPTKDGIRVGKTQADKAAAILRGETPKITAREAAEIGEATREADKKVKASAARAKPVSEGLSIGFMPNSAEPITVKNGVVYVGKYPAQNFETADDITVADGATDEQVVQALRDAGAIAKRQRVFGLAKADEAKSDQPTFTYPTLVDEVQREKILQWHKQGANPETKPSERAIYLPDMSKTKLARLLDKKQFSKNDVEALKDYKYLMLAQPEDAESKGLMTRYASDGGGTLVPTDKFVLVNIDDALKKAAQPENVAPAVDSQAEFNHNGTRIYPIKIAGQDGAPPTMRWAVESSENKKRRQDGERTIGGDSLHATIDEAKKAADFEVKRDQQDSARKERIEAESKAEQAAADAKREANKGKSLTEIKAQGYMAQEIGNSKNIEVVTRAQWVESLLKAGDKPSIRMVDKIKPLSRAAYNRANNEEQSAHEKKIKDGGKVAEYQIGDFIVSKTEYDYAQTIASEGLSAPTKATPQPVENLPEIAEVIRLLRNLANKRLIPDETSLRELITKPLVGADRAINVNVKRYDLARALGLKVSRVPQQRSDALYLSIDKGDSAFLDNTLAEIKSIIQTQGKSQPNTDAGSQLSKAEQKDNEMGLSAPTKADILDQQDRKTNADKLDDKEQIGREASGQTLTSQAAPEQRTDTSGDMFGEESDAAKRSELDNLQKMFETANKDFADATPAIHRSEAARIEKAATTMDKNPDIKRRYKALADMHRATADRKESGQNAMFSRNVFRSALRDGIDGINAKALTGNMWADGIKGLINKGTAKADEVEWSGITDWLKLQEGKVTRDQVLAYLDGNGVRVEETVLSDDGYMRDARGGRIDDGAGGFVVNGKPTKYENYQLPGGENYKELLLTLPDKAEAARQNRNSDFLTLKEEASTRLKKDIRNLYDARDQGLLTAGEKQRLAAIDADAATPRGEAYKSSHWDQANILAHIRFNERTDSTGARVLLIEEIQSDWAQQGKKEGFKSQEAQKDKSAKLRNDAGKIVSGYDNWTDAPTDVKTRVKAMMDEAVAIDAALADERPTAVPNAPFVGKTDAWVSLAIKRMISYAAENGFDKIAFVNGEQSAERYDLSKKVDKISVEAVENLGNLYFADIKMNGGKEINLEVEDGVVRGGEFAGKPLDEVIGKDMADKILSVPKGETKEFSGLDLSVGGEGMKAFYDKIVPTVAKDVLRKLGGGQLTATKIVVDKDGWKITPPSQTVSKKWMLKSSDYNSKGLQFDTEAEAQAALAEKLKTSEQTSFDITPAMRDKAAAGLPMFGRVAASAGAQAQANGVVQKQVDAIKAKWANAPEIIVAYDMQDPKIPQKVRDADLKQRSGGATGTPEGFYYKGVVYLMSSQLKTLDDTVRVLFHESLGHAGLRGNFGTALNPILREIAMARRALVIAKARKYGQVADGTDVETATDKQMWAAMNEQHRMTSAEEVLAELAQTRPELGIVKRAIAAIRTWLRANVPGFKTMALSDADIIQQFILPARNFVERGQQANESGLVPVFARGTNDAVTNPKDVVGNQGGRSADDYQPGTVNFQSFDNDERAKERLNRIRDVEEEYRLPNIHQAVPEDYVPKEASQKTVTIYRGVPSSVKDAAIRPGDWIGLSKKYAADHGTGETGNSKVISIEVPADHVVWAGTDMNEWFYAPREDSPNESTAPDSGGAPMLSRSNPDIRFSRGPIPTEYDDTLATDGWSMPEPTRADKLIYNLQDGRIDLKRVQEAIKATSAEIAEKFDARQAETLYPGRVARRSETFLKVEVKPILQDMAINNIDMAELGDYLIARHAPERNAQIAKVNPDLPDGGAGSNSQGVLMTDDAADEYLAAIPADKLAKLVNLARKVDAITAGTRALLVGEGLEKQETVDAWTKAYKNYVPLFKDEAEHSHPQGRGFTVKGSASKRSTGSTKEVTNVLAHVRMQRETAITRAEKNRVGLALYGLALSNPNTDFWTTIKPNMSNEQVMAELQAMGVDPLLAGVGMASAPTVRTVDPLSDKVVDRPNPMYKNLPGAITLRVNGEDRVLMLNQDNERAMRMAENLKNMDGVTQLELASTIIGKSTRWIASVNTQYNPAFGLVNVTRDTLGGIINLTNTPLRKQKIKVLANVPAALKGIARDLRGDIRTEWSDLFNQFQDDGGQTGYKEMFRTADDQAKAFEKEIASAGKSGLTPGKMAHAVLDLLDDFNTSLENAVRLSAYKAALDEGMSRPASAKLARELTVDFNRKGRAGREIGPLYAFFNASVQGTARTLETLAGPAGAKIIAGGLALGALQALMLAFAGFEDDEPPEFIKSRALIIPIGGEKRYIAIPYPLGLHVIPNTGRVLTELAINGGKDWGKRSVQAIGEIAGAFNPMGGGNVFTTDGALRTLAPTIIDPLIELAANKNFADTTIEKRPFYEEGDNRPGFQRARESTLRTTTGQVYLGFSKAINTMTGGNDFEAGVMSPTPERMRYLAQVVGGGVLRELEKLVNSSMGLINDEEVTARGIPVVGRFYGEIDSNQTERSDYFDTAKTIKKYETSRKAADKAGATDIVDGIIKKHPEVEMADYLNKVQGKISQLNKLAAETVNDRAELKRIDEDRFELMKDLNDEIKLMERDKREPTIAERLRK